MTFTPRYVRPKLKKVARTWELLLAIIIFLFLLYRVLLAYDLLPDAYNPHKLIPKKLEEFKVYLKEHQFEGSTLGKASNMTIKVINDVQAYLKKQQEKEELMVEIEQKCGENSIFRYFMDWDNSSKDCTEQQLQLHYQMDQAGITGTHAPPAPAYTSKPAVKPPAQPTTQPVQH